MHAPLTALLLVLQPLLKFTWACVNVSQRASKYVDFFFPYKPNHEDDHRWRFKLEKKRISLFNNTSCIASFTFYLHHKFNMHVLLPLLLLLSSHLLFRSFFFSSIAVVVVLYLFIYRIIYTRTLLLLLLPPPNYNTYFFTTTAPWIYNEFLFYSTTTTTYLL